MSKHGFDADFIRKYPLGALVSVTDERDGTFIVRIGGEKFTRWPSRAIAERRADHVRRFDAEAARQ